MNQRRREILEGKTIGAWTVETYIGGGRYRCTCVCGVSKAVESGALKRGDSMSCGCQPKRMPTFQAKPKHQPRIKADIE